MWQSGSLCQRLHIVRYLWASVRPPTRRPFCGSGDSSPISTTKVVFTSTTFAELTAAGSSPNFGFRTHAAKSFFGDGRNTSVALLLRSFGVLGRLVIVSEPAQFFWGTAN